MGQISLWNETLSFCSPPISAQGILFCTNECLKSPPDLLKIYLHESSRVYRDKLVEENDFEVFDKLQVDTVKKFYEVRVFYKVQGKTRRREQEEEVEEIIRLPALCLDHDISGQHSEEKEQRIEKKECVLVWEGADGMEGHRGLVRILISMVWGPGCQGLCCQPSKLENILMVFCPLLPSLPSLALLHAH